MIKHINTWKLHKYLNIVVNKTFYRVNYMLIYLLEKERQFMNSIIKIDGVGELSVTENFWTGSKTLSLNGVKLQKVSKKQFSCRLGEQILDIFIDGNFLTGLKCTVNGKTYKVTEAAKWYEYVLAIVPFVFIMVWGNIPATIKIFPVISGALGGAISALLSFTSLYVMKMIKKPYLKVLVGLGFFVLTVLICYVIALAILSAI